MLLSGQISLMGTPPNLGGLITKGNVYLDGSPICDLGWSHEDATVACRFTILCLLTGYSVISNHQDVGIRARVPGSGLHLWGGFSRDPI